MHFYFEPISFKYFLIFAFLHILLFVAYGWQWNIKENAIKKRGDDLLFNLMQEEVDDFLTNENKAFFKWYSVPLVYVLILLTYIYKLPHNTFSPIIIMLLLYFIIHAYSNFSFIYKIVENIKDGKVKNLEEAVDYIEDTQISTIVLKNKKKKDIEKYIEKNKLSKIKDLEDNTVLYKDLEGSLFEVMPTYDNRYTLFSIKKGLSGKFLSIFKETRKPILDLLEAFVVSFLIYMSLIIVKGG